MTYTETMTTELLVIGGGAAGMSAAASAASRGIDVILCDERSELGGILPQCVHKGFGMGRYGCEMTGPEYCEAEKRILASSGAKLLTEACVLRVSPDRSAVVSSPRGLIEIRFCECVLAAGCRERPIGSLPVSGTRPEGIYTAGEAQEAVNIYHRNFGHRILILGSGDIGMIMARRFTLLGKEVIGIAEIRDSLGGLRRNQEECIRAHNIPVFLNSTVTEIHGFPHLTAVTLLHTDTGNSEIIECDTLITSLGLIPDRTLVSDLLTDSGYPEWLHLCGNASEVHEIADSVSAEGDKLGINVSSRLRELGRDRR